MTTTRSLGLRLARQAWQLRLRWDRIRGRQTTVNMTEFTAFYERIWREAAERLGAEMVQLRPGLWRVERGGASTLIDNYVVQIDDPVVLNVAGDKALCHRLFAGCGLPVPEHEVYSLDTIAVAERFMARHTGSYFVVKPAAATSGARGVTTHIENARECRRASALASLYGGRVMIERWIAGESFRLLFLDGEMVHASRRLGLRVIGDGTSTITQLIARGEAKGRRPRTAHATRDVVGTLRAQQLTLTTILERGRCVLVQSVGNAASRNVEIRTVFDEDATASIGRGLRDEAARAVAAIGSRFAGVDVITLDPGLSLRTTGGVINEINTTPGLHHHYNLGGGLTADPPAVRVLDRLLRANDPGATRRSAALAVAASESARSWPA